MPLSVKGLLRKVTRRGQKGYVPTPETELERNERLEMMTQYLGPRNSWLGNPEKK